VHEAEKSLEPQRGIMAKSLAGPVFKIGDLIPCGCRVQRDEGSLKFRLWYCAAHATTFEMLEALRLSLDVLEKVAKHVPSNGEDFSAAMDATMRIRAAVRKASGAY
jgi:hypothetical protein